MCILILLLQNYYNTESEAKNSAVEGSNLGFMKVPKNYTIAIVNSITQKSFSINDTLSKYEIDVEIYLSSKHASI